MAPVKIGVVGCAGRMGIALLRQILRHDSTELSGGTERPGHARLGEDLGLLAGEKATGLTLGDDADALFERAQAVLDFTAPEASAENAERAAQTGTVHVVGTTGLQAEHMAVIEKAAKSTPIIQAANMSLGVNLLIQLTRQVASILDDEFDIEIVEMHHRYKKDAPSGTAIALGEAAAEGRGVAFDAVAERGRDGHTGGREKGAIGMAALRGGNVVGEHTVVFAADDERLELVHKAGDRAIFARGAVQAALWGVHQDPGLYGMADVLGLEKG